MSTPFSGQQRHFSKKKHKKKNKKHATDVEHDDDSDAADDDVEEFEWDEDEIRLEMEEALERLDRQLARIRSGHNPVDSFNTVCSSTNCPNLGGWVEFM